MKQSNTKHVELTYVMNKTQSLENFVYLVGLHIYYKMIHGPYNIKLKWHNLATARGVRVFMLRIHCKCIITELNVDGFCLHVTIWDLRFSTFNSFLFGIKRNCLRSGRSRSLYLSIRRGIKQTVITIGAYHFCQLHTKCCPTPFSQG